MFLIRGLVLVLVYIMSILACNNKPTAYKSTRVTDTTGVIRLQQLIPKPVFIEAHHGAFEFIKEACIYISTENDTLQKIGEYLKNKLQPATGFVLPIAVEAKKRKEGNIYISLVSKDSVAQEEGYYLEITEQFITLCASDAQGLFRGVQSLLQLFPAAIEHNTAQQQLWRIATGIVKDYPKYNYRGAMLDVARHFFEVAEVKRYIDLLAFYKINTLHLHLADDQGWRIEIKSWSKLTSYGGSTEVGGGKGGFYTQEQYKDMVQYAAERYITIIPEIDMPGHTNAALASYPQLNCNPNNKYPKLYTGTRVGFSSVCTKSELVYAFVDSVLHELTSITPGPYVNIGGDESNATKKEDYIYFMNRVQTIVQKYGKQVIGWDEISLSNLLPNTIVQYWQDSSNAINAIHKGAMVLMSPAKKAYLDMKYNASSTFGLTWAGYIEVDDAYNWHPEKLIGGITRQNIIGIEAPLWSETVTNIKEAEYLAFPRLIGYAELGWSPITHRNWDDYKMRLGKHGNRMQAMQINFYKSAKVPWAL
jgi:hexosaminidase